MKKGMGLVIMLLFLLLAVGMSTTSIPYGKIYFVDDDFTPDPSNYKFNDIQSAIDAAGSGDIIYIFPGNYPKNLFINKPLTIIAEEGVYVDGDAAKYAIDIQAPNVTVVGLNIYNGDEACIYTDKENITIKNCIMYGAHDGIYINASRNSLINSTIYSTFCGVRITGSNNSVENCEVYGTDWGMIINNSSMCYVNNSKFYGIENKSIWVNHSSWIYIYGTTFNDSFCGVKFSFSNNSTINSCSFYNNKVGVEFRNSTMNEIINSNIVNNDGYGIFAEASYNNIIHHNNFINNTINAYDDGNNAWNTSIGNYWSDYHGNDSNNDGIGDMPYSIGTNADYRPLMHLIEYPPSFVWVDDDFDNTTPGWQYDHFPDIQSAIDALQANGTCYVYSGNYAHVYINKSVSIYGDGNAVVNGMAITASNVVVSSLKLTDYDRYGISIENGSLFITNSAIYGSYYGVVGKNAMLEMEGCHVYDNSLYGIRINLTIARITHTGIEYNNIGVISIDCILNFTYNNVENNSFIGIKLDGGINNIYHNDIMYNIYGVYALDGNSTIYFNNFINNTINAYDDGNNAWNTSIGNYWSDYHGNDSNNDGIGDMPYSIGTNADYRPLVNKAGIPVARFYYQPEYPDTSNYIHFYDDSIDYDGIIVSWHWDFGDNTTGNERNPLHRYDDNGMYYVTLSIKDNDGNSATITKSINVTNVPPVAEFYHIPVNPSDRDNVTFNASSSYDTDGIIVNYTWNFGDNTTAYGVVAQHLYTDNGVYNVTLTIKDDDGAITNITKSITVKNVPPVAEFAYMPESPTDLDDVVFKSSSADADGIIVNYTWHFDGSTAYGKMVHYRFNESGIYTVTLIVRDDDGAIAEIAKSIFVRNIPPVANFSYKPQNPTDVDDIIFNATSSYDKDGEIVNYTWNFGDGNTSYGNETNHIYGDDGLYTVTLTVKDDSNAEASKSVIINVTNVPPKAMILYSPSHPKEREKIKFNASLSYDRDGEIVNYTWDFGDGSMGYGKEVYHKYSKKGSYVVKLVVKMMMMQLEITRFL